MSPSFRQEGRGAMGETTLGRIVHGLARLSAIAGGTMLLLVAMITVISVVGRAFIWAGLTSIRGDFELVEAGVGFAVFSFLPWAHLTRGHAVVTVFSDLFNARVNAILVVISDLLMLVAAAFLAWRHAAGMVDKLAYGETTLLLRLPLWWAYAIGMPGALIFVLIALYVLARSVADAISASPSHPGQAMVP